MARAFRTRFEPTDLELQKSGVLGLELQSGPVFGQRFRLDHVVATDFELNLGLASNVEFDLDGAVTWERTTGSLGSWLGDPLWPSMKLGLYDRHDDVERRGLAIGLQLGPRFPTFNTGNGIGYAALGLVGVTRRATTLVVNAGYFLDPGERISSGRPSAMVFGLDVSRGLAPNRSLALLGELGGVMYVRGGPNEYNASVGLAWDPSESLELSTTLVGGWLPNGDRLAILFGIAPSIPLW